VLSDSFFSRISFDELISNPGSVLDDLALAVRKISNPDSRKLSLIKVVKK